MAEASPGTAIGFCAYLGELIDSRAGDRVENLVVVARTGSTNDLARRVVEEMVRERGRPPRRTLVVAWEQIRGRGRGGRSWASPPGKGVYASLLLEVEVDHLPTLPLLAAVGLCRALERHLSRPCRIKWPNDLVVGSRKIGGVLIETVAVACSARPAIVGFGVNHALGESELPDRSATSLAIEAGERILVGLGPFTWDLVRGLERELESLGDGGRAATAYRELAAHRPGDRISFRADGEVVSGEFEGFDEQGFLLLETAGGRRRFAAGEVIER